VIAHKKYLQGLGTNAPHSVEPVSHTFASALKVMRLCMTRKGNHDGNWCEHAGLRRCDSSPASSRKAFHLLLDLELDHLGDRR